MVDESLRQPPDRLRNFAKVRMALKIFYLNLKVRDKADSQLDSSTHVRRFPLIIIPSKEQGIIIPLVL